LEHFLEGLYISISSLSIVSLPPFFIGVSARGLSTLI